MGTYTQCLSGAADKQAPIFMAMDEMERMFQGFAGSRPPWRWVLSHWLVTGRTRGGTGAAHMNRTPSCMSLARPGHARLPVQRLAVVDDADVGTPARAGPASRRGTGPARATSKSKPAATLHSMLVAVTLLPCGSSTLHAQS